MGCTGTESSMDVSAEEEDVWAEDELKEVWAVRDDIRVVILYRETQRWKRVCVCVMSGRDYLYGNWDGEERGRMTIYEFWNRM